MPEEEEEKTDEEETPVTTSGTVAELPDEEPVPKEDGGSVATKHDDASGPVPPRGRVPIQAALSLDSDVHEVQGAPAAGALVKDDAIAGTLTMASSVNEKESAWGSATAFGEEEVEYKVDSGTWKAEGGKVNVSGRVFLDIGWKTRSRDRTHVAGPTDPAVTAGTWSPIIADLKPDDTGRPTRKEYWAKDLTEKHELFHAKDDIDRAKLYLPTAQAWLNTQTITDPSNAAATSTEVTALLESVRSKVKADGWAWYGAGGEGRAYDDGKSSYEDRVNSIAAVTAQQGFA